MTETQYTVAFLEQELARLLTWIQAAESRMALVLPLSTAMLGALAVLAPPATKWSVLSAILASLASLFLVVSVLMTALAFFPRTKGPKGSLIYFGGITDRELNQYETAVKQMENIDYIDDLLRQCHRNAQIAERKFTWVQRAMACLFFAFLPWLFCLFLLYQARP
jgi:hypothetical protein